ncbi:hypothetical protein SB767_34720, partial [Bacillus sp. SIMBA_069]
MSSRLNNGFEKQKGAMTMLDMIIRNGQVYDGTGNPWTRSDIGIKDGKIVKLGKLYEQEVMVEIDAKG